MIWLIRKFKYDFLYQFFGTLGIFWILDIFIEFDSDSILTVVIIISLLTVLYLNKQNQQITRLIELLLKKGVVSGGDLILDPVEQAKYLRVISYEPKLLSKSASKHQSKDRNLLELQAQKIADEYSLMSQQAIEDMDFENMSDEQLRVFIKTLKSQTNFNIGYNIFIVTMCLGVGLLLVWIF